MFYLRTAALNF